MNNNKKTIIAGFAAALISTSAMAGGLERQTYSADILFAKGTRIEAAFGTVKPDVTNNGSALVTDDTNINPNYNLRNFGFKFDVSDKLSLALTGYTPLGYDLAYPGPAINTSAHLSSQAYALSAKYMIRDNIALFGSAVHVKIKANAGSLVNPGDVVNANTSSDWGYVVGAAYLKPEIALRIALSFESGTEHSHATDYSLAASVPNSESATPRAIALNFQTGIAANTLLFGGIRHAYQSDAQLFLLGSQLTEFSDVTTYKLGLGRKINDFVSVSASGLYEHGSGTPSTLNPTDGKFTLSGGVKLQLSEHMDLSAGVSRTWLGDNQTKPSAGSVPFTDNSALAFGAKIGFSF